MGKPFIGLQKVGVWGAIALLMVAPLSACRSQQPVATEGVEPESTVPGAIADSTEAGQPGDLPPSTEETVLPDVNTYTVDELFAVGAGGCGMSLWLPGTASPAETNLFFNGLEADSMWMKLDGEFVNFSRTGQSGEEFYGQFTSQTFVSPDGGTTVTVEVTLGEPGEIESISIPSGTLTIQQGNQSAELAVVGGAGC
ncbi:MAG: hypothetical protein VKK04_21790 [Synechococcales bacterium]|nr:hypothetical protein [Synechococcales bacterium]